MNSESFLHQKKVRAMGTFLAVVSCIALFFSLMILPFGLFMSSSWFTSVQNEEAIGEAELAQHGLSDDELREVYAETYEEIRQELPDDATEESFINTMIYLAQTSEGEAVPVPEGEVIEEWIDPVWEFLPEGINADTTIGELVERDLAFFQEHTGTFRLLSILAAVFYTLVGVIILRMALAWRKADPFGRSTILGLRWLAILFIVQFIAGVVIGPFLPHPEYGDLLFHAMIYQVPIDILYGTGANLSCGLVLLTLSWVLEHGRKMKDEQALTI